ncbi:MAG: hypothetical protein U1F41_11585 [Burkholderiales bacterium]
MSGPLPHGRLDPAPSRPEGPRESGNEEGRAVLRALFAQWRVKLLELVRGSVAQCDDLFETHSHIPDGEIEVFRKKRDAWVDKFDRTLCDLFDRRVEDGVRRQGRRPDQETSLATLRVLTAFDHDRQEALKDATRFLDRYTRREIAALELRVEALLAEPGPRDTDNLWSITAKDRSAQKAELTKMIPKLIGALRKGSIAAGVPPERGRAFFEALYQLHIAASRSRARAFVYTPEELAFEIEAGQISLVVEPVPLFDRAVSAVLDQLGARQPPTSAQPTALAST